MKRFIPLIIVILILIGIGIGVWYYQHQKALRLCKESCIYISPKEPSESSSGSRFGQQLAKDKGDYWKGEKRNFESQDQCIDYCLSIK